MKNKPIPIEQFLLDHPDWMTTIDAYSKDGIKVLSVTYHKSNKYRDPKTKQFERVKIVDYLLQHTIKETQK